ncbi:MAG: dynamin family protein [bacterium]|nr:dynamin family protein [bacterium]
MTILSNPANLTLEGPLAALRESEIRLLNEIAASLGETGENAEDRQRLRDVAEDVRDLFFLVVIIGEFNAGKSSFINAVLQDDVLPTGITPTTEVIELIKYGPQTERVPELRPDGIRVWTHSNTGAPGVALVDTPGTGSIFQKHEKTAKSFLHRSDLVIFVISAKRAFAETERLYLDMAKHYGKKIILVVNQIDLLDGAQQQEVRRFVEQQVQELLDLRPLLFMVSAREALTQRRANPDAPDTSGIDAVRAHLRGVFSEMPPARQKLITPLDLADQIVLRQIETVKRRSDAVSADTGKAKDVQTELGKQSEGLGGQLKAARADIDQVFEGMRRRGLDFINTRLSFRQIGRSTSREKLQAEFQDVVIGRALREISDATSGYINALVDNSRLYWRGVLDRLNALRDQLAGELNSLDAGVYAEQREALEEAIRIAEAELRSYSSGKVLGEMEETFRTNMTGFTTSTVAAITGLVVALLAAAAPGPLAGVAAAAFVVAMPVAAFGIAAAIRYYRRVTDTTRREFNQRIDQLQKTYYEALDTLTQKERARLTQYGNQVLTPIFSRLEVLSQRYSADLNQLRGYQSQIATLRRGIEEV